MKTEKLKCHKSPDIDHNSAEAIKAGGRKIRYEIIKLIHSIRNKGQLHEEWKRLIVVTNYNKVDNTNCGNYRDITLLSTTYTILSKFLLSRLTP